jgi:hypothetical protein
MMQKRKLSLSLILASFLLIFCYSFGSAQEVQFEQKTVPYCADVYMSVTVDTPEDLAAFEVIFEVSGDFQSYDVSLTDPFPYAMFTHLSTDGNVVRLGGTRVEQGDVCLPTGATVVATIHFKAGDVCPPAGLIEVAGATVDYPFTHGSLYIACDDLTQDDMTVGTGSVELTNTAPEITCPTPDDPALTVHWGETVMFDVSATDADLINQCEELTFSVSDGEGDIVTDGTTGHFSWVTGGDDVCGQDVTIRVTDKCGEFEECVVSICVYNDPPVITDPTDVIYTVVGVTLSGSVDATDQDGGPSALHYSFVSMTQIDEFDQIEDPVNPEATFDIDPNTGEWTWFIPDEEDIPYLGSWDICLAVDDGANLCDPCSPTNADTACYRIHVSGFKVVIECEDGPDGLGVLQGQSHEVSVSLEDGSSEAIGGFDFLISYDASVLRVLDAEEGDLIDEGVFEYFTYRFGPFGNCDGCPSGMIRVVGMREYNDGATNPEPAPFGPGELVKLNFFVSNNYNYECLSIPIRFFWYDCGDNALSDVTGNILFLGMKVYDFEMTEITDPVLYGFTGPAADCYDTVSTDPFKAPLGGVLFKNGCIKIICTEDIDDRGDVNLNGIANEVADAVVFTNYFIQGLSAFTVNIDGQIAATEVNGDGIALSVADLIYLIKVIIGDAIALPKLTPGDPVKFTTNGVDVSLASETAIGGALFVFDGEVTPRLADNAGHMELMYGYTDGMTRVLVHGGLTRGESISSGSILHIEGDANLVAIEASDANGAIVEVEKIVNLPTEFALKQNYPNPFNPSTTMGLALPVASEWTLTIYNVSGQKVKEFSGASEAGFVPVVWDASNVASGMYFYKLNAVSQEGVFSATKKMLLLK